MAFYRPQSVRDYLELARRIWLRKWLVIGVAAAVTLVVGFFVLRMPRLYTSNALILIDSGTIDPGRTPTTLNVEARLRNLRPMLTSRTELEAIIKDLNLYPEERAGEVMDKVIDHMRKYVQVRVSGRDSFEVSFTHSNPKIAQEVGDRLSRLLINRSVSDDLKTARDKVDFLRKQVARLKQESKTQNDKIVQFTQDNADALSMVGGIAGPGLNPLPLLQEQIKSIDADLRDAQNRKIALANQLDRYRGGGSPAASPEVRDLEKRVSEQRATLSRLTQTNTEAHPDVMKAKDELAAVEAELRSARAAVPKAGPNPQLANIQREIETADGEIRRLRDDKTKLEQEIATARQVAKQNPALTAQIDELKSELKRVNDEMDKVAKDLQQAEFDSQVLESEKGEQFRIQDSANLPQAPDPPGRQLLLLVAGLLGLISGLGVALVLVYFDQTVYNDHELARVTDLPVLVSIPTYALPMGAQEPPASQPGDVN